MFTGIVTDIGTVIELQKRGDLHARIATAYDTQTIDIGASIACDGVCLTVIALGSDPKYWFDVEISAETIAATNIGPIGWAPGKRLNLERPLRVGDELGGHIVSGHVDGTARVQSLTDDGDSTRMTLSVPADLARFIAPKGSVALNGVSLTVNQVEDQDFAINLIPHTQKVTTFSNVAVGDAVNLEIDTLARYVARLQDWRP